MIDQKISHITDKWMLVAEAASSGKENSWQNEQLCLRLLGRRAFTHLRRFLGYAQNVPISHEYGLASSFPAQPRAGAPRPSANQIMGAPHPYN